VFLVNAESSGMCSCETQLQEDSLLPKFVVDSEYESAGALVHPESSVVFCIPPVVNPLDEK
jgi:hypothetical protein